MGEWSTGLFSCFSDITICLISWFIPCYQVGKNAEAVGENCILYGLLYAFVPCIVGMLIRGKIRESKGIEGSTIIDLLLHWACGGCAVSQEARELQGSGGQSMARE